MVLEAIAAVSLAGTVVQFVDFSTKLVSKGYEIYRSVDGASIENGELELIATNLKRHISILAPHKITGASTVDEKALKELCGSCQIVARELLGALSRVKVQGPNTKWKSIQQALKSCWSQEKIEELEKRLAKIKDQVSFHLLGRLTIEQPKLLANLETLARQNEELQKQLRGDYDLMTSELKIISSAQKQKMKADNDEDVVQMSSMLFQLAHDNLEVTLWPRIIHSLQYSQMKDRMLGIAGAHRETLKWLFDADDDQLGENLRHWLSHQDGMFWITGKPGSGKSTLMKHLSGHESTRAMLSIWSDPLELVVCHFYFWNPGSDIQKSQLGLLRTLLHEILTQCPFLIPRILPTRWQSYSLFGGDPKQWTLPELHEAFELFKLERNLGRKFCFFIDGLDEFHGNHDDLIKAVQSLLCVDHVKICASSREWNVFSDAFESCPRLLMQQVTRVDITNYARTEIEQNENFMRLLQSEPERAPELISEIVERASGVFLWVSLVVRSLREGLSNADRIGDLQRRLEQLPTDLEDYFAYILKSTDAFYFTQATQLFRLALEACEQLPLLTLSFCDEEDPDFVYHMTARPLTGSEIASRCEDMKRRLNSRCKGLLEVQERWESELYPGTRNEPAVCLIVDFLHRTVRDFLDIPSVYAQFVAPSSESFNPHVILLRAHVAVLKHLDRTQAIHLEGNFDRFIRPCLIYGVGVEETTGNSHNSLIDEIDRAARINDVDWLRKYCTSDDSELGFLDLAMQFPLPHYVADKLSVMNKPISVVHLISALFRFPSASGSTLRIQVNLPIVQLVLEYGADPNTPYMGWDESPVTPWDQLIRNLRDGHNKMSPKAQRDMVQVLQLLVQHDADLTGYFFHSKSNVFGFLRQVCRQVENEDTQELRDLVEEKREAAKLKKQVAEKNEAVHTSVPTANAKVKSRSGCCFC